MPTPLKQVRSYSHLKPLAASHLAWYSNISKQKRASRFTSRYQVNWFDSSHVRKSMTPYGRAMVVKFGRFFTIYSHVPQHYPGQSWRASTSRSRRSPVISVENTPGNRQVPLYSCSLSRAGLADRWITIRHPAGRKKQERRNGDATRSTVNA